MPNTSPPDTDRTCLNVTDAAAELGVSRAHVYVLMKSGELPSLLIGRRRKIRAAAISEYLQRRESQPYDGHAPREQK